METPSGHPLSPTQISTNSKQPKTPHSESSQADTPQTQISNIYTQKHIYSHSVPTSNSMHHNSDIKLKTNETNNFRKHFLHHKPWRQSTNTTETTVQRNIKEIHHSIVENHIQSLKPNKIINQPAPPINKDKQTLLRKTRRTLAQLRQTNHLSSKATSTK